MSFFSEIPGSVVTSLRVYLTTDNTVFGEVSKSLEDLPKPDDTVRFQIINMKITKKKLCISALM